MASLPKLKSAVHYRVKKVPGHKCNLVFGTDTADKFVEFGSCTPLRRKFRKLMMISAKDPRAKYYTKSLDEFIAEETKHLERYYFMIHPFSDFNFLWKTIMALVHLLILIFFPIYCLTNVKEIQIRGDEPMVNFILILDLMCVFNIVICFFIGYYDTNTDEVILAPKKVMKRYLCTYFFFDFVSTLTYNLIGAYTNLFKPNWFTRIQWALKLVHLITISEYLDIVQLRLALPNYLCRPLKYTIFTIVIILWMIFFNYSLDFYYQRSIIYQNLPMKFFHGAETNLRRLFLIDVHKGNNVSLKTIDLYLDVAFLHGGKLFEIWLLAQMTTVFASYMLVTHKFQTLLGQVKAYVRFKDLPKTMSKRIYRYINFRFQHYIFDENTFMNNLCSTLRKEILWHTCENLVTKVETFKQLPPTVLMKLVTVIKPEIYLPNDVVVQAGEVGSEMFFIYAGVLAVFTEAGKEICHLSDGSHFGEIAMLLHKPRVASVVALDFCELYRLTKKDFNEAIEPYPAVKEKILKSAHDRFQEIRSFSKK